MKIEKPSFKKPQIPKVKLIDDFKTFAFKGNVVDMAVGIIIGASFGKIVSSLVADIVLPPLGLLIGGMDFKDLHVTLKEATDAAAAVNLNYGNFIQVLLDFLIVAFSIFMVVKALSMAKRKDEKIQEAPVAEKPEPSKEEILLTEIRDLLKKNTEK